VGTEFAEAMKYLALSVPKSVCRVMWNSKEKSYMKDIFIRQLDSELQTLCSTKNSSVHSESNGEELLQFSLEKFDSELQSKAPITNKVLNQRGNVIETFWRHVHVSAIKLNTLAM
jgi:hypothetical protein